MKGPPGQAPERPVVDASWKKKSDYLGMVTVRARQWMRQTGLARRSAACWCVAAGTASYGTPRAGVCAVYPVGLTARMLVSEILLSVTDQQKHRLRLISLTHIRTYRSQIGGYHPRPAIPWVCVNLILTSPDDHWHLSQNVLGQRSGCKKMGWCVGGHQHRMSDYTGTRMHTEDFENSLLLFSA